MNKQCLLWAEGLQFKMFLMYGFLIEVNATAPNMQYNHLVLREQILVIYTVAPLHAVCSLGLRNTTAAVLELRKTVEKIMAEESINLFTNLT